MIKNGRFLKMVFQNKSCNFVTENKRRCKREKQKTSDSQKRLHYGCSVEFRTVDVLRAAVATVLHFRFHDDKTIPWFFVRKHEF